MAATGRDIPDGTAGRLRGGVIGVSGDFVVRGNHITVQAYREGTLDVGRQACHLKRGGGGFFGPEPVLGEAAMAFAISASVGAKRATNS